MVNTATTYDKCATDKQFSVEDSLEQESLNMQVTRFLAWTVFAVSCAIVSRQSLQLNKIVFALNCGIVSDNHCNLTNSGPREMCYWQAILYWKPPEYKSCNDCLEAMSQLAANAICYAAFPRPLPFIVASETPRFFLLFLLNLIHAEYMNLGKV